MALVVPLLRLYLLFLNVFETFKTLKPPRRSPRTGEQTPRAISQRKRDMKGCMAIWLLWCSCCVGEGLADNTVGLVMPFYSEIKAVIFLFQIITRSRGAEPIYLHVMRPLVKPYVATLDYALELVHMIGDFIALIFSIPFGFVASWWRPSVQILETPSPASEAETAEPVAQAEEASHEREQLPKRQLSNGNTVGTRTRTVRQTSDSAVRKSTVAGPSRIVRPNGVPHSKSDMSVNQKHKIWRPPVNARDHPDYDEQANRRVVSDSATSTFATSVESSTPPISTPSEFGEISMVVEEVEEWRKYPPFPSAYPTTPQVRPRTINPAPRTQRQSNLNAVYEKPLPQHDTSAPPQERQRRVKPQVPASHSLPTRTGRRVLHSEDEAVTVQDFEDSGLHGGSGDEFGLTERSLNKNVARELEQAEAMNLNDDGDSEDDGEEDMDSIEDEENDSDDDDDTLNVTLRTPPRMKSAKNTTLLTDFPSRVVSPPPELREFHQASHMDEDESGIDTTTDTINRLEIPSSRRRANSNYTLSSMRSSRADSEASFTTASRTSSERTVSRAPSLASKLSSGSASDAVSDTNSVAGVKRARPVQDRGTQRKVSERPITGRGVSRSTVTEVSGKGAALKGTVRARVPNSRPAGTIRLAKSTFVPPKTALKASREAAGSVKLGGYDTLESADEMGVIRNDGGTVKRRKVKVVETATRIERAPSSLAQIPE